ncbi:MAG: ABC transporter permease [Oscillospiraceae bacterium]|nr:ABC transporter permease [Oscillospiraceae bacterium]
MSLSAKLALQQLKTSHKKTMWTLFGIVLAVGMLVAIGNYGASGADTMSSIVADIYGEAQGEGWAGFISTFSVFFGVVIAATAIIVVSNAFRVSAGERTKQFGILKSVGATKKQIRMTVMYEGIFLSLVGLPLGFVAGLVLQFLAVLMTNQLMNTTAHQLSFSLYPGLSVIAILGSFLIIAVSVYLPARKAAKISAISAIRGADELKAKKVRPKNPRIIGKIFGFEGTLAAKQLKRSKRHFRATVISLCISIILILASASLRTHMGVILDGRTEQMGDMSAAMQFFTPFPDTSEINFTSAMDITQALREFPDANVRLHASSSYSLLGYTANLAAHGFQDIANVIVFEPEFHTELAQLAGVPIDSNIIINVELEMDAAGNFIQHIPFSDRTGEIVAVYPFEYSLGRNNTPAMAGIANEPLHIEIHGQITHLPDNMLLLADFTGSLIVPDLNATHYFWQVAATDPLGFLEYAESVFNQHATLQVGEVFVTLDVIDELAMTVAMIDFMSAFTFIFSGMIALLGLTNVISTIAASVQMRSKEFAVLSSVGMDKKGMGRMLSLESVLSSARALIIGLPLGVLIAYLIYLGIDLLPFAPFTIPFNTPWELIIACALGVFITTFVIMKVSAASLKKGNIIETIRGVE